MAWLSNDLKRNVSRNHGVVGVGVGVGFSALLEQAIASGLTTLLGGGTGPATGTRATTCTPHPSHVSVLLFILLFSPSDNCKCVQQYLTNRSLNTLHHYRLIHILHTYLNASIFSLCKVCCFRLKTNVSGAMLVLVYICCRCCCW